MTAQLSQIWVYPIKAVGRQMLGSATLSPSACIPGDRAWAVTREGANIDGSQWERCGNFIRAASAPMLQAVNITSEAADGTFTLTHPDRPDIKIDPAKDGDALVDWLSPVLPEGLKAAKLVQSQTQGMTDSAYPSVTLCNFSSHRAVSQRLGRDLSIHRWRGNLWIDGLAPWEEFDWIGREVQIGDCVLFVEDRTERCRSTEANPETGHRDADVLGALSSWDHADFSVLAKVVRGGSIQPGHKVVVL